MYLFLRGRKAEGCSLLANQTFDFGIIIMSIYRVDKRMKFLPPLWEPIISLHVSLGPLAGVIRVDINPLHSFLSFWEGRLWGPDARKGAAEVTGVVICSAGSTNLGIPEYLGVGPDTSDPSSSLPRRAASSSGVEEGPGSSPAGLNREASQRMPVLAPNSPCTHLQCLGQSHHLFLPHDPEDLRVRGSSGR